MSSTDAPWPGTTGPADDRHGYTIADCRDVRRGGLGIVYRAVLATPRCGLPAGTPVGLKMLTGLDAPRYAKLSGRSSALSQVRHPHLASHLECFVGSPPSVSLVDAEDSRERFASHVWIDGESLSQLISDGRATPIEIVRWTQQLADALDCLHEHPAGPFAHRDVHPRNVIVDDDGSAVLIDYDTVLWTDALDTHLVSFTGFSPARVASGLREAQQGDRWSLVLVLLRSLAEDLEGALTDAELDSRATTALTGIVPRPAASVRRARQLLAQGSSLGASAQVESILNPSSRDSIPSGRKPVRQSVSSALLVAALAVAAVGTVTALSTKTSPSHGAALAATTSLVPATATGSAAGPASPAASPSPKRMPVADASPLPLATGPATPTPSSASGTPQPTTSVPQPSTSRDPRAVPSRPPASRPASRSPSAAPTRATATLGAASLVPAVGATSAPTASPTPPVAVGITEVASRDTHTWSDFQTSGGAEGALVTAFSSVVVSCRTTGFAEFDGNDWWYRISSSPWSGAYYASADVFYNNGATQGAMHGTPYVDSAVPNC